MCNFRIGHGYDVHRLVENRKLILGGVEIPHKTGLLGHSDADVLLHAVMDAVIGALALGDIGKHFPDTSKEFEGISSLALLSRVKSTMDDHGYSLVNLDSTVVLQRPKISPYIEEMLENISKILDAEIGQISIKATTEEGMGFCGRGEGSKAMAVVLLAKK
jgi:2-C-methyl-D-erythritol 2,4-cyclodiphosphate synthase